MAARTVQNKRYDADGAGDNVISADADTETQTGWKVGNTAPSTKYLDTDGKVVDKQPVQGKVLVFEGDTVTRRIADIIAGRTNADGTPVDRG